MSWHILHTTVMESIKNVVQQVKDKTELQYINRAVFE